MLLTFIAHTKRGTFFCANYGSILLTLIAALLWMLMWLKILVLFKLLKWTNALGCLIWMALSHQKVCLFKCECSFMRFYTSSYALICFQTLSSLSAHAFICFYMLSYSFIHFHMLSYALEKLLYALEWFYTLSHAIKVAEKQ